MTVLEQALDLLRSGKAAQAKDLLETIPHPTPRETIALARSLSLLGSMDAVRNLLGPLMEDATRLETEEKVSSASYFALAERRVAPASARATIESVEKLVADCPNQFTRAE